MVWDTLRSLHQQHYFTSRYEGGNKAGMGGGGATGVAGVRLGPTNTS